MESGVYEILSKVDGRRYVGSSVNLDKRWREHRRTLETGKHHSLFLQRSWNKHGADAFEFSVIVYCCQETVLLYEQFYIDELKPEFNTVPTAGSQLGMKHSEETRRKMSASRPKDFSPMTGKSHTPETKARISASRKGKGGGEMSAERRAKIGAAHKGRYISPEMRARISASLTGRKQDPQIVAKRADSNRGRKWSDEERARRGCPLKQEMCHS